MVKDFTHSDSEYKGSHSFTSQEGERGGVPSLDSTDAESSDVNSARKKAAEKSFSDAAGAKEKSANSKPTNASAGLKVILFAGIACMWLALDQVTKLFANDHRIGEVFLDPVLGLFRFRLAHNTGAAWSMFSGSTLLLGVIALIALAIIVAVLIYFARHLTLIEVAALGLVFAGGLGNAIDRFFLGYVVDFIQVLFISFPTFNVADIGVTCGIVVFLICFMVRTFKEDSSEQKEGN